MVIFVDLAYSEHEETEILAVFTYAVESGFQPGARSKFWGVVRVGGRGGVTTVSNTLILGGWVAKVLKNGDKKYGGGGGVEGWVTTIFRLFRPTVLDKKCHFPAYFYTHLPIY